jgi:hypothetical protein
VLVLAVLRGVVLLAVGALLVLGVGHLLPFRIVWTLSRRRTPLTDA